MIKIGTIISVDVARFAIEFYDDETYILDSGNVRKHGAEVGQQWRAKFDPADQYAYLVEQVKVTSSGILRSLDKPRVGVISGHSLNPDSLDSFITEGINLSYEDWLDSVAERIRSEMPDAEESEIDRAIERESDGYMSDGDTFLLGAWVKNAQGKFEIDRSGAHGEFAAEYSGHSNNVTVEWSMHLTRCGHTSPCYLMADGSGPCGDLDSSGDVLAYTLPADMLAREENGDQAD